MLILNNTATANAYPAIGQGGAQLGGPQGIYSSGYFVVANAAVFAQFGYGPQGLQPSSPELFLPPSAYPIAQGVGNPIAGIRFRSAVANTPAQVFGVLFAPHDPTMAIGAEFTSQISSTGGVVPPGGNVTVIFSVTAGGDDGYVAGTGAAYPPAFVTAASGGPQSIPQKTFSAGTYDLRNFLVRFDTSSLPDTAVIQSATLQLYIQGDVSADGRNFVGEWYPGTNWPIDISDGTANVGTSAFTIPIGNLAIGAVNNISLANFVNVNTTGYTGFRTGVDGGAPAGANTVTVAELEHPTNPEPKLTVVYQVSS